MTLIRSPSHVPHPVCKAKKHCLLWAHRLIQLRNYTWIRKVAHALIEVSKVG